MLQCQNMQIRHYHRQLSRRQLHRLQSQISPSYFHPVRLSHRLLRQISLSYFHPVRLSRLGRRHTKLGPHKVLQHRLRHRHRQHRRCR